MRFRTSSFAPLLISLAVAMGSAFAVFATPASAAPISNATTVTPINTQQHTSQGIAADDHYIWISSEANNVGSTNPGTGFVTRVDIDTSQITNITDATFNAPAGIASTGTDVFVADSGANYLSKIDIATGTVTTINNANFTDPYDVMWDGMHLWVANDSSGLVEFDGSGNYVATINDPAIETWATQGLNQAVYSDGTNVWIASISPNGGCGGSCIVQVNAATGTVTNVIIPPQCLYNSSLYLPKPATVFSNGQTVWASTDSCYYWATINISSLPTTNPGTPVTNAVVTIPGGSPPPGTSTYINDIYSMTSDGSTIYAGQQNCYVSNVPCIPTLGISDQSEGAFTNSTFQQLAGSGNYGEVVWARGCLWWANGYYATASNGLLRICDSVTPLTPTTTTPSPTTTVAPASLARTGSNFLVPTALIGAFALSGFCVGMVSRRRRRAAE